MKVGFIGLGQMGQAMAGRLLEAGHELTVYNRSRAAAEPLKSRGAAVADDPLGVLDGEVAITMLADDVAVEAVWIASGLIERMPSSCIHLNMATVSLKMGKRLASLHQAAGARYVSAPVFGRPPAAAQGKLDIVVAGPEDAIERCKPLFGVLGSRWFTVGAEPYRANIVKIARNFLLAAAIESLGEALALVRKSGVDPAVFLDIITSTSFNAPAYKSYGRRIVEKDFEATFALKLGLKDVELALDAGADTRVPLPTADLIRQQHVAAIARGFGEKDWAALGEYISERAGL
ncbi:MAG: NAD(P)-dependent oxidoreductase [Betaproteobacteria bacterium]|nr:NAD(P)-dependent oxidoreductase [Betaproteobacteria bacterium]